VVEVQRAESRVMPLRIPIVGTLDPGEEVTVSTEAPGILERTYVDVGEFVAPKEPLAEVDDFDFAAELAQARAARAEIFARLGVTSLPDESFDLQSVSSVRRAAAQVENARFTYERFAALGSAASKQELSDVSARLRVAEAEYQLALDEAAALVAAARDRNAQVELAERRLAETRTLAPPIPSTLGAPAKARWIVAQRLVTEGQYVAAATPLYRLIIENPLKLRCQIPERYAGEVRVDQVIDLDNIAGASRANGRITRVSPAVDPQTRTFAIEALVENPGDIKAGAFVNGSIHAETSRPSIVLPARAVLTTGGVPHVYIVDEGRAHRRDVRLTGQYEDHVAIAAGLEEGAHVVISGAAALDDGVAVQVRGAAPKEERPQASAGAPS
jgi:RND family efflux transporter MFP subunit